MLSLQAEEDARPECTWRRADSACPGGAGAACPACREHDTVQLVNSAEEEEEEEEGLYLSVIMVSRHDNTQY